MPYQQDAHHHSHGRELAADHLVPGVNCNEAVRMREEKWDEEERLYAEKYPEVEAESSDEEASESETEEDSYSSSDEE